MPRPDELIERFFGWFNQRVRNVESLEAHAIAPTSMVPEQHLLLAAALDALANFWSETFRPELMGPKKAQTRMGEFLANCGGSDAFTRCSRGDLLFRARSDPQKTLVLRRVLQDDPSDGTPMDWRHDPELEVLVATPELAEVGLNRTWLIRSRLGEVIYRYYRCAWVHEFQSSERLSPGTWKPERDYPWYDNRIEMESADAPFSIDRRLVLPKIFLVRTLSSALDNFKAQCIANAKPPAVMQR